MSRLKEQLATVTADRDVKAANLQLLVDKVLAFDTGMTALAGMDLETLAGDSMADRMEASLNELAELARGLKQ